jgi:carbon-monoxide dehydrogenase large subunit
MTGSILGNRVVRKEDPKFLTVGGTYLADLQEPRLEGAVYATYARSAMAHARITSIDTSAAKGMPGVVAVLTGHDLGSIGAVPFNPGVHRPLLAMETVRYAEPRRRPERDTRDRGRRRRADRRRLRPAPVILRLEEALEADAIYRRRREPRLGTAMLGMPASPTTASSTAAT